MKFRAFLSPRHRSGERIEERGVVELVALRRVAPRAAAQRLAANREGRPSRSAAARGGVAARQPLPFEVELLALRGVAPRAAAQRLDRGVSCPSFVPPARTRAGSSQRDNRYRETDTHGGGMFGCGFAALRCISGNCPRRANLSERDPFLLAGFFLVKFVQPAQNETGHGSIRQPVQLGVWRRDFPLHQPMGRNASGVVLSAANTF
jgi:hypothetical protein